MHPLVACAFAFGFMTTSAAAPKNMKIDERFVEQFFSNALAALSASPFYEEIEWQRYNSLNSISEQDFLRETAWVIINSGFKEKTARKLFGFIEIAFQNFASAEKVLSEAELSFDIALGVFNHPGKLKGILAAAELVRKDSFEALRHRIEHRPFETLRLIPFIGETTARHLAKNLGLNVAKPDRHLVRLAEAAKFDSVDSMCRHLSRVFSEQVKVIDLILWRFMAESPTALTKFSKNYRSQETQGEHALPQIALPQIKVKGQRAEIQVISAL
jgi:hypothetical protein